MEARGGGGGGGGEVRKGGREGGREGGRGLKVRKGCEAGSHSSNKYKSPAPFSKVHKICTSRVPNNSKISKAQDNICRLAEFTSILSESRSD